jgi:hypothetical protein
MKIITLNFFLILIISFFACNSGEPKESNQGDVAINQVNPKLKLQIYYFHATDRCPTCTSVEENLKKVLDNSFKNQVANGEINFKILNVDDAANKALAEKYEAAGASLHFVKFDNGKELDNDLTAFAFMHSKTEPDFFIKSMQDTISYFLK